jgi:hypothetical protein
VPRVCDGCALAQLPPLLETWAPDWAWSVGTAPSEGTKVLSSIFLDSWPFGYPAGGTRPVLTPSRTSSVDSWRQPWGE